MLSWFYFHFREYILLEGYSTIKIELSGAILTKEILI
jgi:hypothetical protein